MNVRVEDDGPCRRILHVEAPFETIAEEYDKIVAAYGTAGRVPGFRKGRAPATVVEQRYHRQILEDTRERVFPRLYRQAIEQEQVRAVVVVAVADVSVDRETGVRFRMTVDVAPEFSLPKYRKIPLRRNKADVSDADVSEAFDRLLDRFSRFEDVNDRAVRDGDLVQIDYSGLCEGKPIVEVVPGQQALGKGKDFWAVAGEPEFLPGMGKGLVGLRVGSKKDIPIAFPEDFRIAALAGKLAAYSVEVKAIREKVAPEINEEFLKQFDVDSEEALRDRVREDLEKGAEHHEQERLKQEVAKYLLSKVDFDLPRVIVEQETRSTLHSMAERFARSGATREQLAEHEDRIKETATQTSTERVKLSYILSRIADAESISVSDEEVDRRIAELAARYRISPERFRAELQKRDSVDTVRSELRTDKTLAFLLANAKIKG